MKIEGKLKSDFTKELKRQRPDYYVLHYSTAGAPDREIVGNGITSRWECKHATPDFVSPENQELMCARLATVAHCRYVFWWESSKGTGKKTMIVHPLKVLRRVGCVVVPETWTEGFDHGWLVEQVMKVHRQ